MPVLGLLSGLLSGLFLGLSFGVMSVLISAFSGLRIFVQAGVCKKGDLIKTRGSRYWRVERVEASGRQSFHKIKPSTYRITNH